MISKTNRIYLSLAFATCVCFYVASMAFSIHKPASLDEADLANRSHMITEIGPDTFNDVGKQQFTHPPLYQYTVALLFKLFGENEYAARGFGLVCYLLTALYLVLILRHLLRQESDFLKKSATYIFLAQFCVNPVVVQHSLFMDADTTWMPLFLAALIYYWMRFEKLEGNAFIRSRFWLMGIFALAFLAKEITPFFIAAGGVTYRLLMRQWKRTLLDLGLVFLLGTAVAWMIWLTYCGLTQTDYMAFLDHTLIRKTPRVFKIDFLTSVLSSVERLLRWPVYWASAPFFVLVLGTIFSRLYKFIRSKQLEPFDYLLLMASVVWMPYTFIKPSIDAMKYQQAGFCLWIACISYFLVMLFKSQEGQFRKKLVTDRWALPLVLGVITVGAVHYYQLNDYLLLLWDHPESWRWKPFLTKYHLPTIAMYIVFSVLFLVMRKRWVQGLMLAAFISLFPIHTALAVHQFQPYTTSACWLNYGERGLNDVIEHLATRMDPGSKIVGRHDIAYHLRTRHGLEIEAVFPPKEYFALQDKAKMARFMVDKKIQYIIMDRISLVGIPDNHVKFIVKLTLTEFEVIGEIGRFAVFRRKGV